MAKKAAKKTAKKSAKDVPLEQALADLHKIVAELEGGDISLEDSLERYEAGMTLIRSCHEKLTTAEQKIQRLAGLDADGQPRLEPFDATATADAVQGAGRRSNLFD